MALAGCAGSQLTSVLLFELTDALHAAGCRIADALEGELARCSGDVPDEVLLGWGTGNRRLLRPQQRRRPSRTPSPPWTLHVWLLGATDALAQPLALAQLGHAAGGAKSGGVNCRNQQLGGSTPGSLSDRVAGAQHLLDARCLCPPAPQAVLCVGDGAMRQAADCETAGPCLAGFPPWLASCAEVYPLPGLASVTEHHVAAAWRRLGEAVLRHGA